MIRIIQNFSVQHPEGGITYRFLQDQTYQLLSETAIGYVVEVLNAPAPWTGTIEVPRVLEGETYEKVEGR